MVNVSCVSNKYECPFDGTLNTSRLGQRTGLSPTDVEQLRQYYPDTTLSIFTRIVPFLDPGRFTISLDGRTLVPRFGDAGNNYALGAYSVDVGTHQVSVTAAPGTRISDYSIEFGGDCAADGSVEIARKERKVCELTMTASSTRAACLELCDVGRDTCLASGFLLPRECGQSLQSCRDACEAK